MNITEILLKAVIKTIILTPLETMRGWGVGELELKTKIVERVIPIFSA